MSIQKLATELDKLKAKRAEAVETINSIDRELFSVRNKLLDILLPNYEHVLSLRQLQVLGLIREGLYYAEIAEKLGISLRTVKWHTNLLFKKYGVRARIGLMRLPEKFVP